MVAGKSPEWLPPGFAEKVKYKNGRRIKYYYNAATGETYHSKKDVMSSASTKNVPDGTPQKTNDDDENGISSNNKVDVKLAETKDSPDWLPNGWIVEEKARLSGSRKDKIYIELSSGKRFLKRAAVDRYLNSVDHANTTKEFAQENKVDNADEPIPDMPIKVPMTNEGHVPDKKKKGNFYKPVATVSTLADGLPPGWIKEVVTSKSGQKIRTDPYYTDPVSGYAFRSKPDALRFLKTGDIRSCACRPKRKEELDHLKTQNQILSSDPVKDKSAEDQTKRQLFLGGEVNDGEEISITKILADLDDINESDNAKIPPDSADSLDEKKSLENKNSEKENNSEPANEVSPSIEQKLPESGVEKQTNNKTPGGSRKSKKRKEELTLPSRASKRLAKCESKIPSTPVGKIPSLPSKAPASVPLPFNIEPAKEETLQKKIEKPDIPEEQKEIDESKKSPLGYDFGESWSDPCLEFAFKTLTGEISIDNSQIFPGSFNNQQKPSQSDLVACESSKQHRANNDQLPANNNPSLFSAQGNISFPTFSGFNGQKSSSEFNPWNAK